MTLGGQVRRGEVRPEALLAEAEAKADRLNPEIGAICRRTPQRARATIRDLDRLREQSARTFQMGSPLPASPS